MSMASDSARYHKFNCDLHVLVAKHTAAPRFQIHTTLIPDQLLGFWHSRMRTYTSPKSRARSAITGNVATSPECLDAMQTYRCRLH